uniref:Uncharacterized protein n=1 Tax=Cyanoderma ruficeps TaxID=181631 RepID=A0A8C3XGM2_9PASS
MRTWHPRVCGAVTGPHPHWWAASSRERLWRRYHPWVDLPELPPSQLFGGTQGSRVTQHRTERGLHPEEPYRAPPKPQELHRHLQTHPMAAMFHPLWRKAIPTSPVSTQQEEPSGSAPKSSPPLWGSSWATASNSSPLLDWPPLASGDLLLWEILPPQPPCHG